MVSEKMSFKDDEDNDDKYRPRATNARHTTITLLTQSSRTNKRPMGLDHLLGHLPDRNMVGLHAYNSHVHVYHLCS